MEDIEVTIAVYTIRHHFYADDTQFQAHVHLQELYTCLYRLERCVRAIIDWYSKRCLQQNLDKTELIVFRSKTRLNRLKQEDESQYLVCYNQTIR